MSVDAAADELYGLEPSAFVARRDDLASQARAEKRRDVAAAIKKLQRPVVSAWYLNLAARDKLVSLVAYLRFARDLHDARAAHDSRRALALSRERSAREGRVLSDLARFLLERGVRPSPTALEEVRGTLRGLLDDAAAVEVVASGRLARPVPQGGSGEQSLAEALAAMVGPGALARLDAADAAPGEASKGADAEAEAERRRAAEEERRARERAEAVAAAQRRVLAARREASQAEQRLKDALARADLARRRVEEARRAVDQAESAAARAASGEEGGAAPG